MCNFPNSAFVQFPYREFLGNVQKSPLFVPPKKFMHKKFHAWKFPLKRKNTQFLKFPLFRELHQNCTRKIYGISRDFRHDFHLRLHTQLCARFAPAPLRTSNPVHVWCNFHLRTATLPSMCKMPLFGHAQNVHKMHTFPVHVWCNFHLALATVQ